MNGTVRSAVEHDVIENGGAGTRDIAMPRLSKLHDQARIVAWSVAAGQRVAEGELLGEVEAGTITMEIEAPCDGVVHEVLFPPGLASVAAGTVIARIAPVPHDAKPASAPATPVGEHPTAPAVAPSFARSVGSSQEKSYADAVRDGLAACMSADPDVFVIGESVGEPSRCSPALKGLLEEFGPARVVATPIAPHAVIGLAAGAAMAGLKPVVDVMAWSLALQALDPIIQTAAKTRYRSNGQTGVPLVLRGRNGAWAGSGPMHAMSLAALFAGIPGLKVVCPATPECAKGLIIAAIDDPDPVIVLECDALYDVAGSVPDASDWSVPIGKARIARAGTDLTMVTYGSGVPVALDAAGMLEGDGVSAEVIDLRTLRPLDLPAVLTSVRKTGRLVTLDDGPPICSISSEVCASVAAQAFAALKAPPVRIEAADTPVPHAPNLEQLVYADAGEVAAKALRLVRH